MNQRIQVIVYFISSVIGILFLRVFQLQVLKHPYYKVVAHRNYIQLLRLPAARGIIEDRNGLPLATNRPTFSTVVLPTGLSKKEIKSTIKKVCSMFNLNAADVIENVEKSNPREPIIIKEDMTSWDVVSIEERLPLLPGIHILALPRRKYPYRNLFAHVVGYVGPISKEELEVLSPYGYSHFDFVGKGGIEKFYDKFLKGKDGFRSIEVDAKGKILRILKETPPERGATLVLTLDVRLQKICREELGNRPGTVILMNPNSGEILAMVSSPDFDPNFFLHPDPQTWEKLRKNPLHPLTNRAISALYPPSSTFKLIVTFAGLKEGLLSPQTTHICPGYFRLGKDLFGCWKAHGRVDLAKAIYESCNVYFFQEGLKIGYDKIKEYASLFGIGKPTGIDIPEELSGLFPTPEWKRRKLKEPWYDGDTCNLAIGQGYLLVTPLQLLCAYNIFATEGKCYQPHLVKMIKRGEAVEKIKPAIISKVDAPEEIWKKIKWYLRLVTTKGTAAWVNYLCKFPMAGKTGTAQNPKGKDHAWFVGWAPWDEPVLSIVVLVEHGGSGGGVAAPIAAKIMNRALQIYP